MWTSQQVLTATPVPPTITSLCSSVGHSHSTSTLAPGSFLPPPASLLLVLSYVLLSFPWPTPTRGGPYDPPNSSYDPDFRMAPPSFLSPMAVFNNSNLFIHFSTTDLYNWKNQTPFQHQPWFPNFTNRVYLFQSPPPHVGWLSADYLYPFYYQSKGTDSPWKQLEHSQLPITRG